VPLQADEVAVGIGDDVALATIDARIEASRAAAFRGFHRLAVITPALGLASRPALSRAAVTRA
jgi:hypothetical protein